MRKLATLALVLALAAAFALPFTPRAHAQGGALELGVWVEGDLTEEAFEQTYTLSATAGQTLIIEMQSAGEDYLDPYLILQDAAGNVVAENDDASGLDSAIVYTVAADQEFSLVATRAGQADGSSTGHYKLRASEANVLEVGSSVTTTLSTVEGQNLPSYYVITPADSATWAISFSQPGGDLYMGMALERLSDSIQVMEVDDTMSVRSGTLNVDLDGGETYLLIVQQSLYSWVFEEMSVDVTIDIAAAE
jgi:hypothetical protein